MVCAAAACVLRADPLTRQLDIDFGRDVASRNLRGLAVRSDGRIVSGPALTELAGPALAGLLWTIELADATGDGRRWLVGTGPEGRIFEVTLAGDAFTTRPVARLAEPQVFAVKALPDGAILAGTSPTGALYLLRNGQTIARVILPVDSVFDILVLPTFGAETRNPESKTQDPSSAPPAQVALVATGNPGRIYRVDLAKFARAGVATAKITDAAALASKGITLYGQIRDRNVRRLARLTDGKVAAGSAPSGNVYLFPAPDGSAAPPADPAVPAAAPIVLQENHGAEVTDLFPGPAGDFYACVVYTAATGENRINRLRPAAPPPSAPPPASPAPTDEPSEMPTPVPAPPAPVPEPSPAERFLGRSSAVWFPAGGFPETLFSRDNLAFYRLALRGDLLIVAAGDEGQVLAWDLKNRLSLTFAGSLGSQLNGLIAVPGSRDQFLLLRNNAPGLARLDFAGAGPRRLETNRLDLGLPAELGALRFADLRGATPQDVQVELRTSLGADETEGWTAWTRLGTQDGAYRADGLRGRYVKLRLTAPAAAASLDIDTASLYHLPQDRRPVLIDFRILPPDFALIPAPEQRTPPVATLGQMLNPNFPAPGAEPPPGARTRNAILGSQLVPSAGRRVVYWMVDDPDGDTLAYTFSIKPPAASAWIDLVVNVADNYADFDTTSLPDGLYRTRLIAVEQAPRLAAQRLRAEFATDDLVLDHTPPEILDAAARRDGATVRVTVHGRDALSLLAGVEFAFNNGYRETVQHPVDGILDGREETFQLQTPVRNVGDATSVEVRLSDQPGNTATRRLPLPTAGR